MLGVRAGELPDPEGQNERGGAVHVPGVSVLDEFLQLAPQCRWDLDRGEGSFHRPAHEGPNRIGARPEFVVRSELFEVRLFLSGEANAEKVGRGSLSSSGPHNV